MTNFDFGFNNPEFSGDIEAVPYCQFLNASVSKFGLAISTQNAELAQFELSDGWSPVDHEFVDGTQETLLITQFPRMVVLNRSKPLLRGEDGGIFPYSKEKAKEPGFKAFSYLVVWLLDKNNNPISKLPLRLKCSGYSGITLIKNYQYFNNQQSFCRVLFDAYRSLTGDSSPKNATFYAHGVYAPKLLRKKVTSSFNGQSSFAVVAEGFETPDTTNLSKFIIPNGSPTSDRIKEWIETTKPWLKDNFEDSATDAVSTNESTAATEPNQFDFIPEPVNVTATEIPF